MVHNRQQMQSRPEAASTSTSMSEADCQVYLQVASAALGLPFDREFRPGVLREFLASAADAKSLEAVPLAPHQEGVASFVPVVVEEAR